ncbi:hypothetical protein EJB05_36123 [Eragrostis curvula]|uniref:Uncharacterized protein n=1 Tax=Eragrostis curvula TaxID=38414 RepID=A0A5J9U9S1_9POAL|nr:hypothetical protein EJB05_36123 [Eragrostis curvula]
MAPAQWTHRAHLTRTAIEASFHGEKIPMRFAGPKFCFPRVSPFAMLAFDWEGKQKANMIVWELGAQPFYIVILKKKVMKWQSFAAARVHVTICGRSRRVHRPQL